MLQLLQTEIDIEPGRHPQLPVKSGQVGIGCAILRAVNATEKVLRHEFRLMCDNPFWPHGTSLPWHRFKSLAKVQSAVRQTVYGAGDIPGPLSASLTIHLAPGEMRDVLLSFRVPPVKQIPLSEGRAGAYPLTVCVTTGDYNGGDIGTQTRKQTELKAIALIRPSYDWSVDVQPPGQRLGRLRRSAEVTVELTNRSNDWLYCELRGAPQPQLQMEAWVQRVAIRPPERGELQVCHRIPIRVWTPLKAVRGDSIELPLPIQVVRLHAPSLAPLPDSARQGEIASANAADAVRLSDPQDFRPLPGGAVLYCPPIPRSLSEAMRKLSDALSGRVTTLFQSLRKNRPTKP